MQYRKRPVVIDAFRLGEKGQPTPAPEWFGSPSHDRITDEGIIIPTLEGDMLARWGDWIIRGVQGELYPCRPEIFAATYEPVE
jgi:hypothetical protein